MKLVKRESDFIQDRSGNVYLPRPHGWVSGWMRHMWFEKKVGKKPKIASPDFWKQLSEMYKVMKLIEYEDGRHEIINT